MSEVIRVIVGGGLPAAEPLSAAAVSATTSVPSLAALRDAAVAADTPLLWITDAVATPAPDALARLLDAGTRPAASLPVDTQGSPVEPLIGGYAQADAELLLDATRKRRLPLRHTHALSLLVDRAAVLAARPPDPGRYGPYAAAEWTARLMAGRAGALVPASRVCVQGPAKPAPLPALRMARTGVWQRAEALAELRRLWTG